MPSFFAAPASKCLVAWAWYFVTTILSCYALKIPRNTVPRSRVVHPPYLVDDSIRRGVVFAEIAEYGQNGFVALVPICNEVFKFSLAYHAFSVLA